MQTTLIFVDLRDAIIFWGKFSNRLSPKFNPGQLYSTTKCLAERSLSLSAQMEREPVETLSSFTKVGVPKTTILRSAVQEQQEPIWCRRIDFQRLMLRR